jgi:hypothetical protein
MLCRSESTSVSGLHTAPAEEQVLNTHTYTLPPLPLSPSPVENSWIFWLSWGLALALIIGMHCAGRLLYTSPWNGIFVLVFTLAMSFMLAVVTAYYESDTLAFALIITTAIVCFCFLCALSNIDITKVRIVGLSSFQDVLYDECIRIMVDMTMISRQHDL